MSENPWWSNVWFCLWCGQEIVDDACCLRRRLESGNPMTFAEWQQHAAREIERAQGRGE